MDRQRIFIIEDEWNDPMRQKFPPKPDADSGTWIHAAYKKIKCRLMQAPQTPGIEAYNL